MAKVVDIKQGNRRLDGSWGDIAEVVFEHGGDRYFDVYDCPTCCGPAIAGTINGELEDGFGGLEFLEDNEWGIQVHCPGPYSTDCGEDMEEDED